MKSNPSQATSLLGFPTRFLSAVLSQKSMQVRFQISTLIILRSHSVSFHIIFMSRIHYRGGIIPSVDLKRSEEIQTIVSTRRF